MAVVLTLKWPGYTREQYDQLLELADWENEPARNGIFHVVWWEGDTMAIVGANHGGRFGLDVFWPVWLISIALVPVLYFPCRAFARFKRTSRAGPDAENFIAT